MQGTRLNPEKITHPFQLMAAWFAMLILLVGILLTGAARIERPAWISGFLVISSVVLSILVMAAVFVMLTRFRPHLQGPKEYADWLKDERRFRVQGSQSLEIREVRDTDVSLLQTNSVVSSHFQMSKHVASISDLEGAEKVLRALRRLAFLADIYQPENGEPETEGERHEKKSQHEAIWVGSRISASVAVPAIKTVAKIWPHLRFMHLSTDGDSNTPDYVHDQMY